MPKSVFSATYVRLRELLIQARLNSGLTQAELAQRLSHPQSYVSKYERGERRLDVVELLDVAHILNINVAALIQELQRSIEQGATDAP
jgi:transcriptional regulator with XRE-family HTH domain